MNNSILLTKIFLKESLDTRKFKENKAKTMSFGLFVGLMGLLFVGLATLYSGIYANMFLESGIDLIYEICMFGSVSSLLVLITSITRSKGIFISKDYEMLRSMPITKNDIVSSKIISMYLVELVYSVVIMLPCGVVCSVLSHNILYVILSLALMIVIPGLPIVIGSLLGLFVALYADRSRFGNIISIISYGAFLILVMIFSGTLGGAIGGSIADDDVSTPELSAMTMFLKLATINPTLSFVIKGFEENALWYIAFFAINIIALALTVVLIAKLFDKVYSIVSSAVGNIKYKAQVLKTEGQFKTLFKSEARRYFSSKLYCINTMVSGICAVIMVVMIAFTMGDILSDAEIVPYVRSYGYLASVLIIFGIGLATPASISISMEGNTFWMTKVLPIDYKALTKVKICFSTLVLGVFSIIASAILIVVTKMNAIAAISTVISPLFFVIGASSLGLTLNTGFYKLHWKNEVEVVKNSSGVIISMLADMGITIVLVGFGVLSVVLMNIFNLDAIGPIVFMLANVIFGSIMYMIATFVCPARIQKIEF